MLTVYSVAIVNAQVKVISSAFCDLNWHWGLLFLKNFCKFEVSYSDTSFLEPEVQGLTST